MPRIKDYTDDTRRIPPEHADIHARLENWGRWCKSRQHLGHAFSLEGNYRSPRGVEFEWETASPPPSPLPAPDPFDALEIEHVVRLIPMSPLNYKKALKFVYIYRADYKFCCRRLGVRFDDLAAFLYRMRQMVKNGLLTRELTKGRIPPTIRISA